MTNQEIQNLIKELVEKTNVIVKDITFTETEASDRPGMTMFAVEVNEPHFFIGRDGEGLSALNHLVRRIVETRSVSVLENGGQIPSVLVDINGYQKKRIDNIHAIAHMMAERARYFKSSIEVDPMSAFDRRVVHEFLSNETDLKTESTGEGSTRRVVIKYVGSL